MTAIEILGIDHVVLRVADLERALGFYVEALGCRVERRLDELDLVPVDSPLGQAGGVAPGEGGRNVDHVALRIAHFDESRLREALRAHGIEPGEVARRYGAEGMGPSMYVRDPDGNTVELKGPPEGG